MEKTIWQTSQNARAERSGTTGDVLIGVSGTRNLLDTETVWNYEEPNVREADLEIHSKSINGPYIYPFKTHPCKAYVLTLTPGPHCAIYLYYRRNLI